MSKILKHILCALATVIFSITVPAADLPSLPQDSRIQKGTLACGVTYYMVTNKSDKGYADVAVIRRDEAPSSESRALLNAGFLSRMGIGPGRDGYLSDNDGSTVFRYERVPFYRPEVLDSTLHYAFSQMAVSKAEQAIIVCGDIDQVELKKKMDIFSMMVPRVLVKEAHAPDYVWEPSPAPYVTVKPFPGRNMAEVKVSYSSARTPHQLMNTAQELVTSILGRESRVMLERRLRINLADAAVPVADLKISALRSSDSGGDERYSVSVITEDKYADAAMRVISSTLGEIDAFGASTEEFKDVRRALEPVYLKGMSSPIPRDTDVDRCISNFLYGADLAPLKEEYMLFTRKNVPDDVQASHMNSFSSAILEQLTNLSLEYRVNQDSLDTSDALFYYNLEYLFGSVGPSGKDYTWHFPDSLGMIGLVPRVRVRLEKTEPVTGGKLWTFTNGMRVAFKQTPGSGMFSYAMVLNGGLSRVEDLVDGEGGYFGDILSMYDAGGLSCFAFRGLLESAGISMDAKVTRSNLSISGEGPTERFSLLMKALVALSGERKLNMKAYENFARDEALRPMPIRERMFEELAPGYSFMTARKFQALSPETCARADSYYHERFNRMGDGILVIAGDLDEGVVKKILSRTLGGFKVGRGKLPRDGASMNSIMGTRTVFEQGAPGLYVLMDAEYAVTAKSRYTSELAASAIRKALVSRMAQYGYTVEVVPTCIVQPQERFQMMISCRPANPDGLPESVTQDVERAVSALRLAIRDASSKTIPAVDFKAWQAALLESTAASLASPSGAAEALVSRYAYGKDLTSRYKESINSITADDVQALLNAISAGGRVEFIVDE